MHVCTYIWRGRSRGWGIQKGRTKDGRTWGIHKLCCLNIECIWVQGKQDKRRHIRCAVHGNFSFSFTIYFTMRLQFSSCRSFHRSALECHYDFSNYITCHTSLTSPQGLLDIQNHHLGNGAMALTSFFTGQQQGRAMAKVVPVSPRSLLFEIRSRRAVVVVENAECSFRIQFNMYKIFYWARTCTLHFD